MTGSQTRTPANGQSDPDHALRYESLRTAAVEQCRLSRRDGLVVLLRHGVAAWMDAWSRLPSPPAPAVQTKRQRSSSWSDDASAEVVRILASMTTSNIQEVPV